MSTPPTPSYRFDRYLVEPRTARLLRDGEVVPLEPKTFRVLVYLLQHRARLVDKQELLDAVWGDVVVTENALTKAIARLRKALGDSAREPRYVATVHALGYRFLAPAREENLDEPAQAENRAAQPAIDRGGEAGLGRRSKRRGSSWSRIGILAPSVAVVLVAAFGFSIGGHGDPVERPVSGASGRDRRVAAATVLDARRVVVLPIVDLSVGGVNGHVVDGLTERLISEVARLESVSVVPRTTAMAYRDSSKRVLEIGRELGAGTAVEGSLSEERGEYRLTLRLLDVVREESLWSKERSCGLVELFDAQGDVVARLAEILHAHVGSESGAHRADRWTGKPTAYEHYLRGRAAARESTRVGNERAIEHYLRALEIDEELAPAHAGLATAYGLRIVRYGFDSDDWRAPALASANRALELDPSLAEAYQALSILEFNRSKIHSALAHSRRALALDPSLDEAAFSASAYAFQIGRWDEALLLSLRNWVPVSHRAQQVLELWLLGFDDLSERLADLVLEREPLDLGLGVYRASRQMLAGDLDAARSTVARFDRAHDNHPQLAYLAGQIEARAGNDALALEHFERTLMLAEGHLGAQLRAAMIRWREGDREGVPEILDAIERASRESVEEGGEWPEAFFRLAAVAAIRGRWDESIRWREVAISKGHRLHAWDAGDPLFAGLREDPRFVDQLTRMRAEVAEMKARVERELGTDLERHLLEIVAFAPPSR